MDSILIILAVAGCSAIVRRLLRSAYRAVREGTYVLYARELVAARARRGDLTGLEEAREWVVRARRGRRRALGEAGLWLVLLALPPYILPAPTMVYAACTALWVLPDLEGLGASRGSGGGKV